MSNKTKKSNKVEKATKAVEEEVIEAVEAVDAAVESDKAESTEIVEAETESKDSEAEVTVETIKVFKPFAKAKEVNWKKLAADTLKVVAGGVAGYVVAKKVIGGGEEHSPETAEVVDAEFVEVNDDVDVATEEE